MKRATTILIFTVITVFGFTNCQDKKATDLKTENSQQIDSIDKNANNQLSNVENIKQENALSYNSYTFAENLKKDNFFETDNIDKEIVLKEVGITSYLVSDNEVTLSGVFYNKQKNMAIPRFNNNPPGSAFAPEYFDKLEIKYNEDYKRTYSAALSIILKNPRDVKKLKMYIASESSRNYEYQLNNGLEPEYRSGFIDLVDIKGTFTGTNAASNYPNKIYELSNAEFE